MTINLLLSASRPKPISLLLVISVPLLIAATACAPARLTTEDTCIELRSFDEVLETENAAPSSEDAEALIELSERSSEVLSQELRLLGEVAKGDSEQRERWFLIDAQYDAVRQASETVTEACY